MQSNSSRMENGWLTVLVGMLAGSAPLIALESIRPGLVSTYIPMHWFILILLLIIPAVWKHVSSVE